MITTKVLMSVNSQKNFSTTLDRIIKSTQQDKELTRLNGYINTGFPGEKRTTQEIPLFPWHTIATDLFYRNRMDFLLVADVFSKYIHVSIELSMIVTELGLLHILRNDNGPCYNSNEFQQFLQYYSITHQTSSPNHPRSNGFVEWIVGAAKKLMDKVGKERKPRISGLFEYRITPHAGRLTSPLQMMTQCRPREKNLPQLPNALGALEMHQIHQELIRR